MVKVELVTKKRHLLFFCPEGVAIVNISGIITTNLGESATHAKVRRARKDGYITPKYAFPLTGGRYFFWLLNL